MNKKYNTDLNTIDTSILVEEFDLRLEFDDFKKTKMIKKIIKIDGSMISPDILNTESSNDNSNSNNKSNNNIVTITMEATMEIEI